MRRTPRILLGACLLAALVLAPAPARAGTVPGDDDCLRTVAGIDLQTATVLDLQAAMDDGTITSTRLTRAYLDRIDAYDPQVNALRVRAEDALEQAARLDAERRTSGPRGPLHGIPVLLKDNVGTTDMPTTAGSIALKGSVPLHEATITSKLRDAGAIVLGKLELSEFAGWMDLRMPPGYSSLGGQVLNAYDFDHSPSGSSAGSGVAASMAFAAVTIGTETSGSILSPSNNNGVVGIKPSVGTASRYGILPLSPTFDTPGPMTRSVTDAAVLLGTIAGPDPQDPYAPAVEPPAGNDYRPFLRRDALEGARLGLSQQDVDSLSDDERAVFERAVADLEKLGASIVETETLSSTDAVGLTEIAAIPNEFKFAINLYLTEETSPDLRVRTLSEIIAYNREHPDRVQYGQSLLEASDATLGNYDEPSAVANRTAAVESSQAAIDGTLAANDLDAIIAPGNRYANIGAAALYPSVTVPAGYTQGGIRPLNLTFLGTGGSEPTLVGFGFAYEQATGRRVPPTVTSEDLELVTCPGASPGDRGAAGGTRGTDDGGGEARAAPPALPATGGGVPAAAIVVALLGVAGARSRRGYPRSPASRATAAFSRRARS